MSTNQAPHMVSYAQNCEDVLLYRAFPKAEGFYIDVGAAHPTVHSVTNWFYQLGWHGVNFEPQPEFFSLLQSQRIRDVNLNCAASDQEGTVTFFEMEGNLGCSTVNSTVAEHLSQRQTNVIRRDIKTLTLTQVCEKYAKGEIDFLKIDAEGHEREVLLGMDFNRYRPRVLVIEHSDVEKWNQIPLDAGYHLVQYDGLNQYYVRDEDLEELGERLAAPVNCLDDFARAEGMQLDHGQAARLQQLENLFQALNAKPVLGRILRLSKRFRRFLRSHEALPVSKAEQPAASETPNLAQVHFDDLARELSTFMESDVAQEIARTPDPTNGAKIPSNRQRPKALYALSSSCQMYSGIGRSIFETVKLLKSEFDFHFTMDNGNPKNLEILRQFCQEHEFPLIIGDAIAPCESLDNGNQALSELLQEEWDLLFCDSWGSTATNRAVLKHADRIPTIYTPHTQPVWSVPGAETFGDKINQVHQALVKQAALVVCLSQWEWMSLQAISGQDNCRFISHGIDPNNIKCAESARKEFQLLYVGDHAEPRKRFALTTQVFAEVHKRLPTAKLVVVGNKSEEIKDLVPVEVRSHCDTKGYVTDDELFATYRSSAGLMLLSDYEAFGIPILEALASGTLAFISRRPTVSGLFAKYKGAFLIDDGTPEQMAQIIVDALTQGESYYEDVRQEGRKIVETHSWNSIAKQRGNAIRAALNAKQSEVFQARASA